MSSPFISFLTKSFYAKMIAVMLAVSILPLIVLSVISVSVSSTTVKSQVNRLNAQLVNQVVDRIELTMTRFRELSGQYSAIPSIQDALVAPSAKYYEDVVRKKDLITVLGTASAVIGNVEGLQVYSAITGEVLSSDEAPSPLEDSPYKLIVERFLESGANNQFIDKSDTAAMGMQDNSSYYVSRLPIEPYEELKGVLVISMSNDEYLRQIENIQLGSKGAISLLAENGDTIATTSRLGGEEDAARIAHILQRWREAGQPNQFAMDASIISIKMTSTYDRWIVVSEIPSGELNRSADIIRKTVTYFLLVLILVGVLSVILFGYQLYKPLQAIKRQVTAFKKGRFEVRDAKFANNEIGELGRMLNTMAVRIQELLDNLQESEDLKRRLEIRALQSQINPHFMYNTLNTIRMFAMLKDYGKINEVMGRLVSMLRYSMENFDQNVPLKQELDYARDYVELLNTRYKCRLNLLFDVDPTLENLEIPKLSLQPLIENSVFHGILPMKRESGLVSVKVKRIPDDGGIEMVVADDGVGIEEGELEKLRLHLLREQLGDNIGLLNVWLRLRLHFGKAAQFELHSVPGRGLRIRFLLPADAIHVKEADHHEQN
ncbi:sensor histidine kinase [Cohnella fermenti]|uniref:Sensor histidine kinase n=1 Tax=Cohnella fermenti TaxID=2565925 RepID=A0A4S4BI35_9BACL|nr:histidine kinase [Cohnella fermenti]THF73623.1 sensor histidine kinase [Cohnella fermenti]